MTMLVEPVHLTIPGEPIPKGSLKCVGRPGRHQLVESNPRVAAWRRIVATAAAAGGQRADHWQPVGVDVLFRIDRPTSHFGTGRNARRLRDAAPPFPVQHGTGDVDKLLRLVLDALQDGHLLHDDAQVVASYAAKMWADSAAGATITVYPVEGSAP
jgi:crossover junction endodeoxyribonuclease RusA